MRTSILILMILNLTSCKPRGFDNPLKIDLANSTKELCSGNVSREFENLDNRYIEFETTVYSIRRTHFIAKVRCRYTGVYGTDSDGEDELLLKISTDEETLSQIDINKRFKFRGEFKFNFLRESYCTRYEKEYKSAFYVDRNEVLVDLYEIKDAILIEEIVESE